MEMLNTVRSSKVINDCNMIVTTNYAPENEPWNLKITQLKSENYLSKPPFVLGSTCQTLQGVGSHVAFCLTFFPP